MDLTDHGLQRVIIQASEQAIQGNIQIAGRADAGTDEDYTEDKFIEEEEEEDNSELLEEQSKEQTFGGRYITDALMLKCATNAKTKDKKQLIKKEGRGFFFSILTHMNLEQQKLVSIEENEELSAKIQKKTRLKENGLKACKKLEVLYLFENRLTKLSETMLSFKKLLRLSLWDN